MHPDALNPEWLEGQRLVGDPEADQLFLDILEGGADLRTLWNHMLDVMNDVQRAPELLLSPDTSLSEHFAEFPPSFDAHFHPSPVPDWVEWERLARAAEIWKRDAIWILGALYCSSLPYCYLIGRGIPALYRSGRLKKHQYIYQRLYETGLMIDAVCEHGGIELVDDLRMDQESRLRKAIRDIHPDAKITMKGDRLVIDPPVSLEALRKELKDENRNAKHISTRRFWGRGFIAVRKVRAYHAAMRQMFLAKSPKAKRESFDGKNADSFIDQVSKETKGWNRDQFGVPVNQEDLAYTLLTFGYTIPLGLATLGLNWTDGEKDDWWHLWRTVGHILGIQQELLPADRFEAGKLFPVMVDHLAEKTDQGIALTETLEGFLAEYLPPFFGMPKYLPKMLIEKMMDQRQPSTGDPLVRLVVPKGPRPLKLRLLMLLAPRVLWLYFTTRRLAFKVPLVRLNATAITSGVADALIGSWRDAFMRHPYYISAGVDTAWVRKPGVDQEFLDQLQDWRHSVFSRGLFIVLMIIVGVTFGTLGLAWTGILLFDSSHQQFLWGWLPWDRLNLCAAVVSGVASSLIPFCWWELQGVVGRRPKPIQHEAWISETASIHGPKTTPPTKAPAES